MNWDSREYLRQRRTFINERSHRHPLIGATALIFTVTWLFGWGCSALLLHAGILSMPIRYALSFLASYGVFFLCVRIWCNSVHHDKRPNDGNVDFGGGGDEGCLVVLLIALSALAVATLFWATGGAAALLEAAFEVTFAGTVVRRLSRTEIVGNWAHKLFARTWLHALVVLLVLVGVASALERAAPNAHHFSAAVKVWWAKP